MSSAACGLENNSSICSTSSSTASCVGICLNCSLCCSPVLEDVKALDLLKNEVLSYSTANGIAMIKQGIVSGIPCTLLPTPIPRLAYEEIEKLCPLFNSLYDKISRNLNFLIDSLAETSKVDPFVKRLLDIVKIIHSEGESQPIRLCINRSDYMMHAEETGKFIPLQVEFNTISAGLGCLSTKVSQMHRYMVSRHVPQYTSLDNLPSNRAMQNIIKAMAIAANKFQTLYSAAINLPIAVLMVVQETEWNIIDQHLLQFGLWEQYNIPLMRKTLAQIHDEARLNSQKQLELDGYVIALTYFRSGYSPKDYPTEKEWSALLSIERCFSIKCPSVSYHLAGTKKIQQLLTSPELLARFVPPASAGLIQKSFAGIWGLELDHKETPDIIAEAIANPSAFVLKPQREGGGNNLWGEEMVKKLKETDRKELTAYILMKIIKAPTAISAGLRGGSYQIFSGVNEIGIFGSFLSDGETVFLNESCGYLLRTKAVGKHEGGISAGSGFLDSVALV